MSAVQLSEHEIQTQFFDQIRLFEGRFPILKLVFAIPNGSSKKITQNPKTGAWYSLEGQKMAREGLRSGVADVFCAIPCWDDEEDFKRPGLFIEFKKKGGKQSPEQKEFQLLVEAQEYRYVTVYDAESAWNELRAYLDPLDTLPTWEGQ